LALGLSAPTSDLSGSFTSDEFNKMGMAERKKETCGAGNLEAAAGFNYQLRRAASARQPGGRQLPPMYYNWCYFPLAKAASKYREDGIPRLMCNRCGRLVARDSGPVVRGPLATANHIAILNSAAPLRFSALSLRTGSIDFTAALPSFLEGSESSRVEASIGVLLGYAALALLMSRPFLLSFALEFSCLYLLGASRMRPSVARQLEASSDAANEERRCPQTLRKRDEPDLLIRRCAHVGDRDLCRECQHYPTGGARVKHFANHATLGFRAQV
jgi:hypothetical protein